MAKTSLAQFDRKWQKPMRQDEGQHKSKLLASYRQLLSKIDQKFSEILERNSAQMKCGAGCHSCCVPNLSVFAIEKENLVELIRATPGLEQKLRTLAAQDPFSGQRCKFLEADGKCAVYEARPLVCRSHGAPLFSKQDDKTLLDVCPLNFDDIKNLAELGSENFVNLDLINTILAAINKELDLSGERTPLDIDALVRS
jgi:Fe-S-cluster containining protein